MDLQIGIYGRLGALWICISSIGIQINIWRELHLCLKIAWRKGLVRLQISGGCRSDLLGRMVRDSGCDGGLYWVVGDSILVDGSPLWAFDPP